MHPSYVDETDLDHWLDIAYIFGSYLMYNEGKLVKDGTRICTCVGPTLVRGYNGECSRGGAAASLPKAHTPAEYRVTRGGQYCWLQQGSGMFASEQCRGDEL